MTAPSSSAPAIAHVSPESSAEVLIASADAALRRRLCAEASPAATREAGGGAEALAQLEASSPAAVWLDRRLPDLQAEELAAIIRRLYPAIEVRLVEADAPQASTGAAALRTPRVAAWAGGDAGPMMPPGGVEPLPGMRGRGPVMQQLFRLARLVAQRDTAVLITGESGTGKELVARAVHHLSRRAQQPWVVVNCAALPESLLEAELFGHARGAFTGAVQAQLGRIHAAHRGTLFLDEIGELPLGMQAKLLRFVQEGEVQRLGSVDVFRVDVRLLAATNADLERRVEEGRFRADLFYRLSVFPLELPPLRHRREDVVELAHDLLLGLARRGGAAPKALAAAAAEMLAGYNWPGNVRQLHHALERAAILAEEGREIEPGHLPAALHRFIAAAAEPAARRPPQRADADGRGGKAAGAETAGSDFVNRAWDEIGSQAARA
ncbi:MAG: sigma 54-interacting transcriptional regulator [Terriglobales bacterium]